MEKGKLQDEWEDKGKLQDEWVIGNCRVGNVYSCSFILMRLINCQISYFAMAEHMMYFTDEFSLFF